MTNHEVHRARALMRRRIRAVLTERRLARLSEGAPAGPACDGPADHADERQLR